MPLCGGTALLCLGYGLLLPRDQRSGGLFCAASRNIAESPMYTASAAATSIQITVHTMRRAFFCRRQSDDAMIPATAAKKSMIAVKRFIRRLLSRQIYVSRLSGGAQFQLSAQPSPQSSAGSYRGASQPAANTFPASS